MARKIKESDVRRSEILAAAQSLIYTRGYETMTIQDILDALQISKGAFYHYFDSKQELLEALIERMVEEARQLLIDLLAEASLPALQRLERLFAAANAWKTARNDYFLALLKVWYNDNNAIVRQKAQDSSTKMFTPFLSDIIQQGIREGVIQTDYPQQSAGVVLAILVALGDAISRLFLSSQTEAELIPQVEHLSAAYVGAIERTLHIMPGSLHLVDAESLKVWVKGLG